MNRKINKVAVLGSGVMGSRIACHFANIGVEVLLLDIVPKDSGTDKKSRNKNNLGRGTSLAVAGRMFEVCRFRCGKKD